MLRLLKNFFRRPPIRMGSVDNSRIKTTRLRNAQFVSFITESGSLAPFSTDRYDARLRWKKRFKGVLIASLSAGAAWVIVESARALTIF